MAIFVALIVYGAKLLGFTQWAEEFLAKRAEQQKRAAITKAQADAPKTAQELIDLQNRGDF